MSSCCCCCCCLSSLRVSDEPTEPLPARQSPHEPLVFHSPSTRSSVTCITMYQHQYRISVYNNNNNEHICIAQNKNPQMRSDVRYTCCRRRKPSFEVAPTTVSTILVDRVFFHLRVTLFAVSNSGLLFTNGRSSQPAPRCTITRFVPILLSLLAKKHFPHVTLNSVP